MLPPCCFISELEEINYFSLSKILMSTPGLVFSVFHSILGKKNRFDRLKSKKLLALNLSPWETEDVLLRASLHEQLSSMELLRPRDPVQGLKSGYIFLGTYEVNF